MEVVETDHRILCCECAIPIVPNNLNMCANCLNQRHDIGSAVSKQVQQNTCRGCNRFERRDGSWAEVEPESKELLALLLRKPRGLTAVRLVDASYIWTEPHSKRIKLKLTVQKEVAAAAVLQQSFVVEYVLGNKQCTTCQRREAKDTWVAVVQLRQKVLHKRTFFYLEQLILKHRAHTDTTNIVEARDGIDFYFGARAHAEKLVSFLSSVAPVRTKNSKQLIATDTHTGKTRNKFTYSAEVLPLCREDIVWLPSKTSHEIGHLARLALVSKVSNVVHLLDPRTMQTAELQPLTYWKAPFKAAMGRSQLIEYVVIDIELEEEPWERRRGGGGGGGGGCGEKRDAGGELWLPLGTQANQAVDTAKTARAARAMEARKSKLAEITVARRDEFGLNDRSMRTISHLGGVLKVGDYAWGYSVAASQLNSEVSDAEAKQLPEVVLVKKSYSERRRKPRMRHWKLQQLQKEADAGVVRGRHMDTSGYEDQFEEFMQDLEEDPTLRKDVDLYRDPDVPMHARRAEVLPPGSHAAAAAPSGAPPEHHAVR
eukprot:CAMPEP_0183342490 /NCGR_PEP_ID=MMETSP0164_2-20130417/8591_1 /TAXON_ID=221442 /ORGANISM="Coccolithus pelagicus ssp braarudi, Strain PLY182g" /LENGTH=540 /DNA_ID=CAMNT_0025513099 /DNA_START=84 /DNA_END=1702 /DNA_ORIENTATION=-